MPKTRNAFAFRDFDGKRILQRPYFKEWREKYHVDESKSDKEILAFAEIYYSDIQLTETKNEMLTAISTRLDDFMKWIQRHANSVDGKLEIYRRRVIQKDFGDAQKKIEHVDELSRHYIIDVVRAVGDLSVTVKELWQASEQDLQNEYRRRFGERLKAAREKSGLSRKKFAAVCNLSMQQVYYYENGQREPSLTSLKRFSQILKVSVDELLK